MSGKRSKTDEEKEVAKHREFSSVVCKLARICKDPGLLAEIRQTCLVFKQIQLEAWHIANLHVLRCLDNGITIPILDQTFFSWCCRGARASGIRKPKPKEVEDVKLDRQRSPKRSVDKDLQKTVELYRAARETTNGYAAPSPLEYDGDILLSIAGQMRVNTQNMIALHFEKRLSMYVRLMLEEGSEERAPAAAVKRLVRACYRAEGGDFAEDELLLREWLGFIPYEDFIRKNVELAVSKLYEISQKVEASQQKDPAKKGIRTFSLLPYSKSYAAAHIVINGTTLHGFCARIFKVTGGHNPLNIPLTGPGGVLIYKEAFGKQKELFLRRGFEISKFETMVPNAAITKQAFDAMDHDVKARFASRVFANQITTNGYSASVLLTRPKTTLELEIAEITNERKRKRLKGERTNETIDVEWYALPDDYETDMMVAIDPGMRTLCTAVSKGGISPLTRESANKKNKLSRVRRKRRKKGAQARLTKKHRRQLRKRRKISRRIVRYPREVDDQLIHSISTREYRHLAGMNKHRYWNENLRKRKHEYSEAISRIPSYKTASFDKYFARLHIFWKCVSFLIKFCAENAFLKWRFFVSRMKTKTLDALAKRLVPVASPRVLVGYGDWSRRDKITGHAPGPVKGFKRALKKRATVVPVDEFRTSKLCSCCHEFLEKALLPVKTEDGEFVLEETRNVLRCSSSACKATFWNRDVNAARNIFALLKSKLLGLSRPKAFRRA